MAIESLGSTLRETAFLGNNVANEPYRRVVIQGAERVNTEVLHGIDDPARNAAVRNLIHEVSGNQFNNSAEVEAAASSGDVDAQNLRYFVCDAALVAMRDGGDTRFSDALATGDPTQIEAVLPRELKPWARDIRNRYIDDHNITAVIDQITEWEMDDPNALRDAGKALDKLAASGADPDQLRLARQAVKMLFDQARTPKKADDGYMEAMLEMQKKDAQENFGVWIADILSTQPFNIMDEGKQKFVTNPNLVGIDVNQFGPEGKKKWSTLVSVANTINKWAVTRVKSGYRPGEMMSPSSELSNVTKNEFAEVLNMEVNGEKPLLHAAKEIYQRLFEQDTDFPDDEVFALRIKRGAGRYTSDRVAMMEEVAQSMVADGIVGDENLARVFVATAAHLFCDVTLIDSADKSRGNNAWAIDGLRVEFSPGAKIDAKVGLEEDHDPAGDAAFGASFFKWSRRLLGLGDRVRHSNGESVKDRWLRLRDERKVAILPRYTCLSWQEMTCVEVTDGNGDVHEMTIAQMLMGVGADNRPLRNEQAEVAEVHLSGGEGTDFFCGTYARDVYPALWKMSQRIIGNKDLLLDLADEGARAKQLEKLSNDRSDLLGKCWKPRGIKNGGHYADDEKRPILDSVWNDMTVVARVIQGSTPMAGFDPHPYFMTASGLRPKDQGGTPLMYSDYITDLVNTMFGAGLDDAAMKRALARELNAVYIGPGLLEGPRDMARAKKREIEVKREVTEIKVAEKETRKTVRLSNWNG